MRSNPHNLRSNFFRMSPEAFDRLLSLVGSHIAKCDSRREPISPQIRLGVTLSSICSIYLSYAKYLSSVGGYNVAGTLHLVTAWQV
ncbi:hypothetical protein NQ315_011293 [Exocentrus adspersus]|uniref:Uncharacterized protein n=1 Tax=Exocentrus adspersus TaxID=1586481 RepID=A0AAV8VKG7_9CUCU|nr:hypothetical protein NQ315_011293 [Exocentrus adspersus]